MESLQPKMFNWRMECRARCQRGLALETKIKREVII